MKYQLVADFLSSTIGLEPSSLGETGLVHAIESLIKLMDCSDEHELMQKITSDKDVLAHLIMVTTIPETWFFREPQSFVALCEIVRKFYVKNPSGIFRILSMACCSGEEPYSAAMTLLDSGMPKNSFLIDAFDINVFSLEAARRGIYQPKSFRQSSREYDSLRERFFVPGNEDGQFVLDSGVIQTVNFSQANLTDISSMPPHKYHAIFCRNVLIYLTPAARQNVIDYIQSALVDGGTLFLGPSELVTSEYFTPLKHPHSFGYVFNANPQPTALEKMPEPKPAQKKKTFVAKTRIRPEESKAQLRKAYHWNIPAPAQELPRDPIEKARALADMGNLKQAAEICTDFMKHNVSNPSPKAFYLMGVINEAQGKHDDAWECFQKALYLQSDHLESMQYLWLLAKQKGDASAAGNMQRRMQRIIQRRKEHSVK